MREVIDLRKFLALLVICLICTLTTISFAAESPTCVVVKFSNDTRYKNVESEVLLSELVVEKLLESGKFNIVETKPINEDIESLIYDEKSHEILNLKSGISQGNFNALFEGPGFDPKQAESIATAQVGQIIIPSITSKIGNDNKAEYLIQGTIINMGKGTWDDNEDMNTIAGWASLIERVITRSTSSVFDIFKSNEKTAAIGLQSDLRIIKASTGEVIWNKKVSGYSGKKAESDSIYLKEVKLESEMYASVVENAANEIVKLLIKDLEEGKLFVK